MSRTSPSQQPEARRAYYAANRERLPAYRREWRAKNPERDKATLRRSYRKNILRRREGATRFRIAHRAEILPKLREYSRVHYLKNKAKYQQRNRLYYLKNKARYRARDRGKYAKNPVKYAEQARKRRAVVRGVSKIESKQVEALVRQWKSESHFTCFYCTLTFPVKLLHVDHVKPICRGGDHTPGNICKSCPSCNSRKWANPVSGLVVKDQILLL